MDIYEAAERLMGMTDSVWRRHASPWSVYTRFAILPLLVLAIYSHVWLGYWAFVPVIAVLILTWANTRIFPAPRSIEGWAPKATIGERLFLERKDNPVPLRHARAANRLTALAALGVPVIAWGVIMTNPWAAILGTILSFLGKLWFCDRIVWMYEDMCRDNPAIRTRYEALITTPRTS